MSVRWITWAWEVRCPNPTTKLTLIALADHAGEDGVCWPSSGRLSDKTGQNERTIRRHLDDLEALGVLTRTRRRRPDGTLGTYTIRLAPADNLSAGAPDIDVRTTGHPVSEPPDTHVRAEPSYEPSEEPSDARFVESEALCEHLARSIEEWGSKRPKITKDWVKEMERLIRLDGRTAQEIRFSVTWLFTSNDEIATFWAPNIQSPKKLRQKWDQIRAQVQRKSRNGVKSNPVVTNLRDRALAAGMPDPLQEAQRMIADIERKRR